MRSRSKFNPAIKPLAILAAVLCAAGALVSMFVVLVRVPALSTTKLESLNSTLQGTAVAMLFALAALLINLTYMVYRASCPVVGEGDSLR